MKIIESFMTKNPCYQTNLKPNGDSRYLNFQKNGPQGLMLHSVGCPQPDATVFISNWNRSSYDSACVHAFIDGNSGNVYQALPWNYRAWHCGDAANNTHVGVEMCEPDCIKYTSGANFTCSNTSKAKAIATRTYNSAVELFATLCKQYKLDPLKDGVIISHAEGAKRGIASAHADPEHLWRQLKMNYTMDTFRKAVSEKLKELNGGSTPEPEPAPAPAPAPAPSTSVPYLVQVTTSALNFRYGPGSNYSVAGTITDQGVYTIVEEANGSGASKWGKLKSGAGWVSLDYVKRLDGTAPVTPRTHTVKSGESWWSIAADELGNGTRYEELAAYNGMTSKSVIHPGDVLKIPGTAVAAPVERVHVVTSGESWWSIAADELGNGMRYEELARYNGKTSGSMLYVGDKVKIPVE